MEEGERLHKAEFGGSTRKLISVLMFIVLPVLLQVILI